jgi:hypothetical protein
MKTDRQRLQLALDFAYQKDLLGKNQKDLRGEIDTFLGSTPADHDNFDPANVWPDCPGGAGVDVSVAGPIRMASFPTDASLLRFQKMVKRLIEDALVEAVEIKMAVDGEDYTLELPAGSTGSGTKLGRTAIRVIGEGVNRILEIHADAVDAYLLIVGLLVKGDAKLRQCVAPDCPIPFVREGRRQYCSNRCSQRVRTRKYRKNNPEKAGDN